MTRAIVIACLAICCSAHAQDDSMPFGQIGDADVDRLAEFAKKSGFDLKPEMERVYKKDEEALARLFKFSLAFQTLDVNARTYGQIIYSSLLNLGEGIGVDAYVKVLDHQSPEVQQRVRDFLYLSGAARAEGGAQKSRGRKQPHVSYAIPRRFSVRT